MFYRGIDGLGGVIVGTSNKIPDELYRNGVQKERLEPFVEALKARCPVTILDAETDWREVSSASHSLDRTWFTPDQRIQFDKALQTLTFRRRQILIFADLPCC